MLRRAWKNKRNGSRCGLFFSPFSPCTLTQQREKGGRERAWTERESRKSFEERERRKRRSFFSGFDGLLSMLSPPLEGKMTSRSLSLALTFVISVVFSFPPQVRVH